MANVIIEFDEPTFVTYVNKIDEAVISPLIFSTENSLPLRICIFVFYISMSIANIFFLICYCINPLLKNYGNAYLACAGGADLMITIMLSINNVILFSGRWDTYLMCKLEQFIVQSATYFYNIFYALAAFKFYSRIGPTKHRNLSSFLRVIPTAIVVAVIGFTLAGLGVYYELDYDYCERKHQENWMFRLITSIVAIILPGIFGIGLSVITLYASYRRTLLNPQYTPTLSYRIATNIFKPFLINYLMFFIGWLPYYFMVNKYPTTENNVFYIFAYIGTLRSLFSGHLFCMFSSIFRKTYCDLYAYCFCLNKLPDRYNRQFEDLELVTIPDERRVHIYHIPESSSRSNITEM